MEKKALLFDMDGVLVDSMRYHARSFEKTLREIGIDIDKKDIYKLEGEGSEFAINHLLEKEGVDMSEEVINELVKRKREIFDDIDKIQLFPEIKELLKELKEDFRLGLVTGSNRQTVETFLEKYFQDLFDVVVTGEDTEKNKPDPAPFLSGFNKLDVDKEEVLVFENSPLGVRSAKEAGLECWAVATYLEKESLEEVGADRVFEDHQELVEHTRKALLNGG